MSYQYQPLHDDGSYIRLVTIHPGTFDDSISVSLDGAKFAQEPPLQYEALSYVWGSKGNRKTVQVKDSELSQGTIMVTPNLAVALRHLRRVERPRVVWIDALCIDQSNDREKGPQVALMGEIYRLASRVVAWLGPEEDNSNRGMELMDYLGSQVVTSFGGSYGLRPALGTTDASLSDSEVALPFDATELEAIYHLICRDWFDRLWVRQEISLANVDGVVVCGFREVAWHRFRTALAALFRKKHKPFPLSSQLESQIDRIRGFIFQPPNVHLHQLRHYFEYAECGDPRDRIYGVLSLLPRDDGALGIKPDYSKTAIQIYEDAALQHIKNRYRFDILFQCELPANGVPAGPSWVPDWSRKSRNVWDWDKMSASSKLMDWFRHNSNNRTLTLAGIVSEVIDDVQPIRFQLGMGTKDVFEAIHAMLPRGIRLDSQYVGGGAC